MEFQFDLFIYFPSLLSDGETCTVLKLSVRRVLLLDSTLCCVCVIFPGALFQVEEIQKALYRDDEKAGLCSGLRSK